MTSPAQGARHVTIALCLCLVSHAALAQTADEFFETRVRPVLAENCYSCHSDTARGDLRLNSREAVLLGGYSGPVIVRGDPDASLLIQAVRHSSDDLQMPMLADRDIDALVEWVRMDAPWPGSSALPAATASVNDTAATAITEAERAFWSFQPLGKPAAPHVSDASWPQTDIDRFILARLEGQGLEPVGPASRQALVRRATFDLTGLPPTPDAIDAFVNDESPDAFGTLVDRLLASTQHGEHWGRHWLDVVRYGEDDTRGLALGGDGREEYPSAYVYRDWVIKAFNEDLPFDRFIRAQLAGDLLEEPERAKALGGLGFLGGGPWYYDIAEPTVARADERHDRVDVTTRGFLGLTVGCARCHDHKYDPIVSKDYYALAGIFANTDYPEYPQAPEDQVSTYKKAKEYIEGLDKGLKAYLATESEQLSRVLSMQSARYMVAAWKVSGEPEQPITKVVTDDMLDLEALQRWLTFLAKEPKHYPYLAGWQAMIAAGGTAEKAQTLADAFQRRLLELVAERTKLEEKNRKIIAKGMPLDEVKWTAMPNEFKSFFAQYQLELETIDRERINLFTDVFRFDLDGPVAPPNRTPGLLSFKGWSLERQLSRVSAAHVTAVRAEIEKRKSELPTQYPFVMGVADKPDEELADLGLHIRGNPHTLGDPVPRRFLSVLSDTEPAPFASGSGRLGLADAIVAHPITARVIVNRVWRWHFGTGLVDTPSNFGLMGEAPSHPELLEYLATWFVDHGRSLKSLHREIMRSAVYQLGTNRQEASYAVDAPNRLYWRANRRRLDAEALRDALLSVAGGLDSKVGGPSLALDAEKNDRRTVYGTVSRFRLAEYLQVFDFPNPRITAEKRFTTNMPVQSLFLMNSDFLYRQAQRLVRRLSGQPIDPEPEATDTTAAMQPGDPSRESTSTGSASRRTLAKQRRQTPRPTTLQHTTTAA